MEHHSTIFPQNLNAINDQSSNTLIVDYSQQVQNEGHIYLNTTNHQYTHKLSRASTLTSTDKRKREIIPNEILFTEHMHQQLLPNMSSLLINAKKLYYVDYFYLLKEQTYSGPQSCTFNDNAGTATQKCTTILFDLDHCWIHSSFPLLTKQVWWPLFIQQFSSFHVVHSVLHGMEK